MKKECYRALVTLPAHADFEKVFDDLLEQGYAYLGTNWIVFPSGVISGVWELDIVETIYRDDYGCICGYHKERNYEPDRRPKRKT